MTSSRGNTGVIKYEVRSTKYEVKKLGATELRGGEVEEAKPEQRRGTKSMYCGVEAPLVCRACVTRMGSGITAFFENFIGTGMKKTNPTSPPLHHICPKKKMSFVVGGDQELEGEGGAGREQGKENSRRRQGNS